MKMNKVYGDMWTAFAAAAATGICVGRPPGAYDPVSPEETPEQQAEQIAASAARVADAMLVEWRRRFEETQEATPGRHVAGAIIRSDARGMPVYPQQAKVMATRVEVVKPPLTSTHVPREPNRRLFDPNDARAAMVASADAAEDPAAPVAPPAEPAIMIDDPAVVTSPNGVPGG